MDTTLLVTSLLLTLLFIGLSTYFLLFRPKSTGPVIYILGPTGAGKTALWSYVIPPSLTL
jgi:Cdc6-like AAA superfamily ATPase